MYAENGSKVRGYVCWYVYKQEYVGTYYTHLNDCLTPRQVGSFYGDYTPYANPDPGDEMITYLDPGDTHLNSRKTVPLSVLFS